jgi:DNA-binding beta-propeller fold protein YncE
MDGAPHQLKPVAVIEIPDSADTLFDHGALEPETQRVFVAHTARDRLEVIDHANACHVASLDGFPEAAGVVADAGHVLVTNRGAAGLAWVDGRSLETRAVLDTGARPNGVALVARSNLAVVACIGDDGHGAKLQVFRLDADQRWSIDLPGRPRWCVTDADGSRVFLAIREPSMVLAARLPQLDDVRHWMLPSHGAHGLDIDRERSLIYVACDGGALIELDAHGGEIRGTWPLAGVPDATFFNPASGLVHVAVGDPGVIESIDPRTGARSRTATALGAKTTALAAPDRLYVFSPAHRGSIVLAETLSLSSRAQRSTNPGESRGK